MPCVGGKEDEPDAATGLTPSQVVAIRESWALVNEEADKHGVELLIRLFREDPKTKMYFAGFQDKSEDELRTDSDMTSHAGKVMAGVTALVDNLENVPVLVDKIKALAGDHHGIGVKSQEFKTVLNVLQGLLKDGLGEKYDVITAEGWKQCCNVIHSIIDSEMRTLQ